ncbi:hypothetical protein HanPSC8_Chr07g0271781 [Helianthus annuus]|nr:hypothetical protein HanPSC8_Chr07g0271781 [Helianthus annuus]
MVESKPRRGAAPPLHTDTFTGRCSNLRCANQSREQPEQISFEALNTPAKGERSPFLESEERESGKGKKEVKAKLVSYSYTCFHLIGEHVYRHAFIVMEQFKKKLGSHLCRAASH